MLREELARRGVPMPQAKTAAEWEAMRGDVLTLMQKEVYGIRPPKPDRVTYTDVTTWEEEEVFMSGIHDKYRIQVEVELSGRKASFAFHMGIPRTKEPCPAFVSLSFYPDIVNPYQPAEEILDRGFAVASICYGEVTKDDGDFADNFADLIYGGRERGPEDPGKIMIWAWTASLVMDYLMTREEIDHDHIAVIGHSRLGKTALVTGAFDERFAYVISNDSGCGGAAVSRGKGGETIEKIIARFPFWFCLNYQKYVGREDEMPFDQNWLLSLIAPRKLLVASASEDLWADPNSEYLGAFAAGEISKLYGRGFAGPDRFPEPGDRFYYGDVTYHQRAGKHYLSRNDWNLYMDYILRDMGR